MTRVAIYARFSSDKQSETSAEDQARLYQQRADREGWSVVDVFTDLALSGASRNRPGLNALLEQSGTFDVVLAESIDRISRDMEDTSAIYKRLRFAGVRIVTLSEGEIGELQVGFGGTMAAVYLKSLAEKTRRGQIGRVSAGRIPGGLSYGYDLVPALDARGRPDRGQRTINHAEAAIVQRIFAEYLAGVSPKAIAEQLNRDGVPAPSGRTWGASTINGNPRRGTGILHNALYVGQIVYNRQRFEKHPETRRRVAKANPREEWLTAEVPELRIIDDLTWQAVKLRNAHLADVPARLQRRPKRLFSGLVRCCACNARYIIIAGETWGCGGHRGGHGCTNNRTINTAELERRVLGALRTKMLAPDVVAEFIREFHRVVEADRRERISGRDVLTRRRDRATLKLERLANAIADGADFGELRSQVQKLTAERDMIAAELLELEAQPVIAMHPGLADVYRRKLEVLELALKSHGAAEAREQIRALLDGIVATPKEDGRGVDLDLQGRLAAILALTQEGPAPMGPAYLRALTLEMVAGAGFVRKRRLTAIAA